MFYDIVFIRVFCVPLLRSLSFRVVQIELLTLIAAGDLVTTIFRGKDLKKRNHAKD